MLKLSNSANFRIILLSSILSERPFEITKESQFEECEETFIRLLLKLTNGSKAQISKDGQTLKFYPGVITNNNEIPLDFNCGVQRSITYFLEPLLILCLFGKFSLNLKLSGITNDTYDLSIDSLMNCTIPLISKFTDKQSQMQLKIIRRGFRPKGNGLVEFHCNPIKYLKSINLTDIGLFFRIRGIAYASKSTSSMITRMITQFRGNLNEYLQDIWIYSDFQKQKKLAEIENSGGYGLEIYAETKNGNIINIDSMYSINSDIQENIPENIADNAAKKLLDEMTFSGTVDSSSQWIVLILMALAEKKISKIKLGRITAYTIQTLRIIKEFFGITFQIYPDENYILQNNNNNNNDDQIEIESQNQEEEQEQQGKYMIFSCMGICLTNISRIMN